VGSDWARLDEGKQFLGAAPCTSPVLVQINYRTVIPSFAGISGPGLYQLNLIVPPGLPSGDLQLQAIIGGAVTPSNVVLSVY
jgi:uncharacterized protein (TIGR03437 family)